MPPKSVKPVYVKTDARLPAGMVHVTGDRGSIGMRNPEANQWKKEEAASEVSQLMDVKERVTAQSDTPAAYNC
ncbi:hypothetical protein NDU88_004422 [Pleurodeles waltl]|uniref:Uncharacterized protein n=1 Tax=Pleurodeles waltl TaxID=8319 RepID=A0AAV7PFQ1_PLEWA|nr:hypothetical protein NDU88_004422 [Pleurodeles waltl]